MKVGWGEEHFIKEFRKWFKKTCGYTLGLRPGGNQFNVYPNSFWQGFDGNAFLPCKIAAEVSTARGEIFSKGYTDLTVRVFNEKYFDRIRKFARAYEKKTKKEVRILREY